MKPTCSPRSASYGAAGVVLRATVTVVLVALMAWPERHVRAMSFISALDFRGCGPGGMELRRIFEGNFLADGEPEFLANDPAQRIYLRPASWNPDESEAFYRHGALSVMAHLWESIALGGS